MRMLSPGQHSMGDFFSIQSSKSRSVAYLVLRTHDAGLSAPGEREKNAW